MLGTIVFIGGSRADGRLLAEILDNRALPLTLRFHQAREAGDLDNAATGEDLLLWVVDARQGWTDWRDHLARAAGSAVPTALFGFDSTSGDPDEALALGAIAVYPGDSSGLLAVANLASTLAQVAASRCEHVARPEKPQAKAAQDQVLFAISHDFQAPLQLSHRYARVLNEDHRQLLDREGREIVDHLLANLDLSQEMLDELLDYARLQSAARHEQPLDLEAMLSETLELHRLDIDETSARVVTDKLPTVRGDRRQFQRLFQNLIGNAIKFRGDSPLAISVHCEKGDGEWRFSVCDNGIGFKESDKNRIFDMFKRSGTAADRPGNGMGLALCKSIIENHGGRIWANSAPGQGCRINFSLPEGRVLRTATEPSQDGTENNKSTAG